MLPAVGSFRCGAEECRRSSSVLRARSALRTASSSIRIASVRGLSLRSDLSLSRLSSFCEGKELSQEAHVEAGPHPQRCPIIHQIECVALAHEELAEKLAEIGVIGFVVEAAQGDMVSAGAAQLCGSVPQRTGVIQI